MFSLESICKMYVSIKWFFGLLILVLKEIKSTIPRTQLSFWYISPSSSIGLFEIRVLALCSASSLSAVYEPPCQYSMVFTFYVLYFHLGILILIFFSFWGLNFSHIVLLGNPFSKEMVSGILFVCILNLKKSSLLELSPSPCPWRY